jgi:cytoskeletal protein RodZ
MTNEIDSSEGKALQAKNFGVAFREAREQAGFSVERAAVATRISASFIEALESQDFKVLPGEIFGRGFVRNLCRAYGVDARPMVAAYDSALSAQQGEALAESPREAKAKGHNSSQRLNAPAAPRQPSVDKEALQKKAASAWRLLKPAVIALPIFLGVLWVGQSLYQSYRSAQSQPEPLVPAAIVKEAPTPAQTPVASAPEAVPAPVVETPAPAPTEAAPGQILGTGIEFVDVTVKEAVQMRYGRDRDKQIIETFQPLTYRFQFDEQLRLLVNDMSAVEIRFKGQLIPNKGVKGEGRYMTFAVSEGTLAKNREKTKL